MIKLERYEQYLQDKKQDIKTNSKNIITRSDAQTISQTLLGEYKKGKKV